MSTISETYLVRVRRIGVGRERWLAGAEPLTWTDNRQRALRLADAGLARRWADWVRLARADLRADVMWEFAWEMSRRMQAPTRLHTAPDGSRPRSP